MCRSNMDDVTRAMSKGGGVLVNVQEWGRFSIFRRAGDVTRTMSKGGGGACECLHPPPPFQEIPMILCAGKDPPRDP